MANSVEIHSNRLTPEDILAAIKHIPHLPVLPTIHIPLLTLHQVAILRRVATPAVPQAAAAANKEVY